MSVCKPLTARRKVWLVLFARDRDILMGVRVQVEGLLVAGTPFVSVIVQSTNNLRGRREEQRILPRIVIAFLWGGRRCLGAFE